jgi:SET domain-containing protein
MSDSSVEVLPSAIHGLGMFATANLPAGVRIIEYAGAKITKAESLARCERNNACIFALDDQHDLDGAVGWNPARFINHSCVPNCDAALIDGRIWIVARRDISPGEELSFNYGYDLEGLREHPCRCGARECVGYMVAEELFPMLRRLRANGALPAQAG